MNDDIDDVIDAMLRDQFDAPVADNGFCERMVERLPARRRRANWPLSVGVLAGVVLCWFSLWSAPIAYAGWRDWLAGDLSASAMTLFVAMTGMAILALAWTIAEADDRYDPWPRRIAR